MRHAIQMARRKPRSGHRNLSPLWLLASCASLSVLWMTGCSQDPSQHSTGGNAIDLREPDAASTRLEGSWQVAAVDGQSIVGVTLQGNDDTLAWEPACAGWSISYQRDASSIRFFNIAGPTEELRIVCSIRYPDRLPSIFHILPLLDRVEAVEGGRIRLSGRGHSILLERRLSDADRPVKTLEGRWRVSALDGEELAIRALQFVITANIITWQPSCAGQARAYVIENERFRVYPLPPPAPSPPPSSQIVPPAPVCVLPLHPRLESAFAAMDAATHIRPVGNGEIMIEGDGRELVLMPIGK